MQIHVDRQLFAKAGDVKIGIIRYQGIVADAIPPMLVGRLQLYIEHLHTELESKSWNAYEGIVSWRKVFKQTGSDPSRYRPSVESLFRRVKKEAYTPSGNSAIALNNFFSLQYTCPLGIYDLSAVKGDVEFRIGVAEDTYEGLNGRVNKLEGIIGSFDQVGPFGSPYVDSVRTSVNDRTSDALHSIYFHPEITIEQSQQIMHAISKMFLQVHGGESAIHLLSQECNIIKI